MGGKVRMLLRRRSSAILNPSWNDVELLQSDIRHYDAHIT